MKTRMSTNVILLLQPQGHICNSVLRAMQLKWGVFFPVSAEQCLHAQSRFINGFVIKQLKLGRPS